MRFPKPLRLIGALAVLALGLAAWIALPLIKKEVTTAHLTWDASGASISVFGFITSQNPDRIIVLCQWDPSHSPGQSLQLDFPGSTVDIASGRYTAGISPVQGGRFQINFYVRSFPGFLKRVDIPIHCKDAASNRDLGLRLLSLRYWPSQHNDFLWFYRIDRSAAMEGIDASYATGRKSIPITPKDVAFITTQQGGRL